MSDPSWLDRTAADKTRPPVSPIFLVLLVVFVMAAVMLGVGQGGIYGVFAFVFVGWIISLCLHEFGHAAIAYAGGDRSVAEKGYLTLDPLRYANPFLSIILPLVFLAMGGIGFPGGAVYVDRNAIRSPRWRAAMSLAGPAMNLLCLIAIAVALRFPFAPSLMAALAFLALLQASALVLNLLPIPGFDGFGAISPFLPPALRDLAARYGAFVGLIFLGLIIALPQALAPIWDAAVLLCLTLGVQPFDVGMGLNLFRFWQREEFGTF